jgi:hypothetical protein
MSEEKTDAQKKELPWYAGPLSTLGYVVAYTIPPIVFAYAAKDLFQSYEAIIDGFVVGFGLDIVIGVATWETKEDKQKSDSRKKEE